MFFVSVDPFAPGVPTFLSETWAGVMSMTSQRQSEAPGVGVGSAVGVDVGVGSAVGVDVGVGSAVGVDVGVGSAVGVAVGVGSAVGVAVGVGSAVGVDDGVGVAVGSGWQVLFCGSPEQMFEQQSLFFEQVAGGSQQIPGVAVGVAVGVGSAVGVAVGVGSAVGVAVGVGSAVGVGTIPARAGDVSAKSIPDTTKLQNRFVGRSIIEISPFYPATIRPDQIELLQSVWRPQRKLTGITQRGLLVYTPRTLQTPYHQIQLPIKRKNIHFQLVRRFFNSTGGDGKTPRKVCSTQRENLFLFTYSEKLGNQALREVASGLCAAARVECRQPKHS
jgi:hypothetical protein